jgi:hypothetical protein
MQLFVNVLSFERHVYVFLFVPEFHHVSFPAPGLLEDSLGPEFGSK